MNDRIDVSERFWLIVFGVGLILLVLAGPTSMGEYPRGSLRNEPIYWLVLTAIGVGFGVFLIVGGLRGGRRPHRRRLSEFLELGRNRLRDPIEYAHRVDLPTGVVEQRIRHAVDGGMTITPETPNRSRQSAAGAIDHGQITLVLRDANAMTRRRSWNVTFKGRLVEDGDGTIVRGTADIPDRKQLNEIVVLFRILSAVPALIVGGLAIRGWMTFGTWTLGEVIPAVSLSLVAFAVTTWLRIDGEAAAASDAASIVRFLDETLAEPPPANSRY